MTLAWRSIFKMQTSFLIRRQFEQYRNFLYKVIVKTENVSLKFKLENFLSFDGRSDAFLGYNYIGFFDYSHSWLLKYFLESFSMVILLRNGLFVIRR